MRGNTPEENIYTDRSIRYGRWAKDADRKASASTLRLTASICRAAAETGGERPRSVELADAAHCESLAERKEREAVE
jgi:hypothetical protein